MIVVRTPLILLLALLVAAAAFIPPPAATSAMSNIDARLRLRPNDGPVAGSASARGRDFPPSASGTLQWDDGVEAPELATFTTDDNGEFDIAFTVPEAEPGDHTVTAKVGDNAASDGFTVTTENAPKEQAGRPAEDAATAAPVPSSITSAKATYPARDDLCPTPVAGGRNLEVTNGTELVAALAGAQAGDEIRMQPGRYLGTFVLEQSGTEDAPIVLCGSREATIDGGDIGNGYALHITGDFISVRGISVQHALKGVILDAANHVTLEYLDVSLTGHEAIHLRSGSSDNVVQFNDVHDTGFKRDKFGEGIYIGSAVSNWGQYSDGQPDTSDRNRVIGNRIWNTRSESIDIKEGTTGGLIDGNIMDGSLLAGADSWVDVKGNAYIIQNNTGTASPMDGFQTHVINDMDWGQGNVFTGNTAHVGGPGFGFYIHDAEASGNVVSCDNAVDGAEKGFANLDCDTPSTRT